MENKRVELTQKSVWRKGRVDTNQQAEETDSQIRSGVQELW